MWIEAVIETGFGLGLFANAMLFVPQAIKLLKVKDSKELSLITFFGFVLIQIFVILHGIIKNDPILTYGTLLSLITCGYVTYLIVYYRAKKFLQVKRISSADVVTNG